MNSKLVIGLVGSFVGGVFAGIAGTYVYMKKAYCDKKIEEGIEEYILHRYDGSSGDGAKNAKDDKEADDGEIKIEPSAVPKYQTPVEDRVPYDEFYDKKPPQDILAESEHPLDSDEDDDDNEILDSMGEEEREVYLEGLNASKEHEAYVKNQLNPIEIITEDEYGRLPGYEDDVLVYWLGDDILTDETEDVVFEQLSDSLSPAFSDEWHETAEKDVDSDEARLYIRNHEFMKDYMILPDIRAYYETH